MKRSKRIISILLCLLIATALFACEKKEPAQTAAPDAGGEPSANGEPGEEGTPANTGTPKRDYVNVAVGLDSGTLDPVYITGGFLQVIPSYMEALYDYHADGSVNWVLATSMDPVEGSNGMEYTLKLREGVTFSNGNPFTADDVLFTMNLEKDHPSRFLDVQYVDFEKTDKVDDYTIDLWFTSFNVVNEAKLTSMLILDAESYDAEKMSADPIGTGPYVVTDYVVNSHLTVTARPDYWGEAPAIKTVNYKVINESAQVVNALEVGDIDVAMLPTEDVEFINGLGRYSVYEYNTGYCITNYYNMTDGGALGTPEARWAVNYATDVDTIIDLVYNGYAFPVDWPASIGLLDYEPRFGNQHDTYQTKYDLAKAEKYAQESGLVGKTLTIVTNGAANYTTMAEIMQSDLKKIGVEVNIKSYDQATYYSVIMDPLQYDIAMYATSAPAKIASDILTNYFTFFPLGWADEPRLAFIEQGMKIMTEQDPAVRSDLLLAHAKNFAEISPMYAICDTPSFSCYNNDLVGYEIYFSGDTRPQYWAYK